MSSHMTLKWFWFPGNEGSCRLYMNLEFNIVSFFWQFTTFKKQVNRCIICYSVEKKIIWNNICFRTENKDHIFTGSNITMWSRAHTHTYTHKCDSTCFGAPQESIKGQQSGVSFVQSSHVLCACSADCVCVTLHTALITSQASSSVVIFIFKPCQKNSTRLRWKCPLTHKGWFTACSTFIICYKLCTVHSFLDKYSLFFFFHSGIDTIIKCSNVFSFNIFIRTIWLWHIMNVLAK